MGCSQISVANCLEIVLQLLFGMLSYKMLLRCLRGYKTWSGAFQECFHTSTFLKFSSYSWHGNSFWFKRWKDSTTLDWEFVKSQNPGMGWVGKEIKNQPVPWAGIFSTPSLEHSQGFLICGI